MRRKLMLSAGLAALIAGCGSGGTTQTMTRPVETTDPPAKLAPGWRTDINRVSGFSIGVPPVWISQLSGGSTLLSSPDKAVAIQISADRTNEAMTVPLDSFAAGLARSLPSIGNLRVLGDPVRFPDRYPGASIRARGTDKQSGVPQKLEVVVLRRDAVAAYPILAAVNASKGSVFAQQTDAIIRSLRGRPIEGAPTG